MQNQTYSCPAASSDILLKGQNFIVFGYEQALI
jgi:hypothetical protein